MIFKSIEFSYITPESFLFFENCMNIVVGLINITYIISNRKMYHIGRCMLFLFVTLSFTRNHIAMNTNGYNLLNNYREYTT